MIKFINTKFKSQVNVTKDSSFENCDFVATGTGKKDKVFGLEVTNGASLTVKNSSFATTGYSAIHMASNGDIKLVDNNFVCGNNYNPIEGAVSEGSTKNVSLINNSFSGVCGNNYVNFYRMDEGAQVIMSGNRFNSISPDSEVIRISNPLNVHANFNVKGDKYNFGPGEATDYTSFIMLQDYTSKSGKPQDFSKIIINLEGVLCNDKVLDAERGPVFGKTYFVYEDSKGIINTNNPVIIIK